MHQHKAPLPSGQDEQPLSQRPRHTWKPRVGVQAGAGGFSKGGRYMHFEKALCPGLPQA